MIFVMIYVSFDMILGAYLLGNMTALIVKGSKTEKFRDKMSEIIRYVNKNKLDSQICHQIKDHLRLKYDRSYTGSFILQEIPTTIRTKVFPISYIVKTIFVTDVFISFLDACLQISISLYEEFIQKVCLFKGCSSGFVKQMVRKSLHAHTKPSSVIASITVVLMRNVRLKICFNRQPK